MIHATNHPDGCLLMVDNIWNRWQLWQTVQNNRQLSLIPEDPNNNFIDDTIIKNKAKEHFSSYNVMTSYNKALAEFYMRNGAICEKHKVAKVLKEFEKEGHISVLRNPAFTATGRPTTFMSESSNQKVHIKWES